MSQYSLITEEEHDYYSFEFAGRKVRLSNHPGTVLSVERLSAGTYETPLPILLMASIARSEGAFCDVGANIGIYTILAAKTKVDTYVYAFEPLQTARDVLQTNLKINDISEQVEVWQDALSDRNDVAPLFLPDAGHGLLETSASLEPEFKIAAGTVEVSIKTLDDLGLSKPLSVIKADIEGHEAAFLRGSARTLSEQRPIVFAEMLSPASKSFFALSKFMADLMYLPFRMRPDAVIYTEVVIADKGGTMLLFQSKNLTSSVNAVELTISKYFGATDLEKGRVHLWQNISMWS